MPWSDGSQVKAPRPVRVALADDSDRDNPGDLITSYLILNLNEPCKIADTCWIKPGKYVGIWWEMHLGKWTWASGHKHGATTDEHQALHRLRRRATASTACWSKAGTKAGTATGSSNGDEFSFTEPIPISTSRARRATPSQKGVRLIGHHETGGAIANYERQMDDAFALYEKLGVACGQDRLCRLAQAASASTNGQAARMARRPVHGSPPPAVIEEAAKHQIMLDVHEPVKDTGLRRTYPNLMTREGARGRSTTPGAPTAAIRPSTRRSCPSRGCWPGRWTSRPAFSTSTFTSAATEQPREHDAGQAARAVRRALQPAADGGRPAENYANRPAFKFIRDVPTDWETRGC